MFKRDLYGWCVGNELGVEGRASRMQETRLKATAGSLGKAGLGWRDGTDEGKGGNQG